MNLSRMSPLLAVAVAVAVVPASVSASTSTKPRCAVATGKTVAASALARAYTRPGRGTWICALPAGRSYPLPDVDSFPDDSRIVTVVVAGRYVAAERRADLRTGRLHDITVYNATTGRARRAAGLEATSTVLALRVTPRAAAVWLERTAEGSVRIWKLDTGGAVNAKPTMLDEGAIDATSLAVADTRAYWLKDGQSATAPLS